MSTSKLRAATPAVHPSPRHIQTITAGFRERSILGEDVHVLQYLHAFTCNLLVQGIRCTLIARVLLPSCGLYYGGGHEPDPIPRTPANGSIDLPTSTRPS